MDIELSFIIPAYNCEDSLRKCVDSIESDIQGRNCTCEIIIIENGSTDGTWDVGESLKGKYKNVALLKSDKGVSKARNKGMKEAHGSWIILVDADDEWIRGSIEEIQKVARPYCCDLLMYSYYKGDKKIVHDYKHMNGAFSGRLDDFKAWLLVRPTLRMPIWAKVFSSRIIRNYNLEFDEELSFSEDSEFLFRYVKKCNSVLVSNLPIYRYSCAGVSAVRTYSPDRQKMYLKSLEITARDVEDEPLIVKNAYVEYVLAHLNLIAVHDIFDLQIKEPIWEKFRKMRKLIQEPVFHKALRDIPLNKCLTMQLSPEAFIKCHLSIVGGGICYVKALLNYRQQTASDRQITVDGQIAADGQATDIGGVTSP